MSEKAENKVQKLKVWNSEGAVGDHGHVYHRITLKSILDDLLDILLLHKGFFFTLKELTIAPGRAIRGYLDTARMRYTHPLKYLFIIVAVYLFVVFRTDVITGENIEVSGDGMDPEEFQTLLQGWIKDTFQLWMAFAILFFALFSFLFFRKSGFNFTEHVVVNSYVYGHLTLLNLIFLYIDYLFGLDIFLFVSILISLIWIVWVYHQTFKFKWMQSIWRSLLSVILAYACFVASALFIISLFFVGKINVLF